MAVKTSKITVTGVVQGVGFRPFVYKQAVALGIKGNVSNTSRAVEIIAQGTEEAVAALEEAIRTRPPRQSRIESVTCEEIAGRSPYPGFTIEPSRAGGEREVRISRDLALCPECLKELFDPADRRYLYPYINCTNCGPRFTIVRDIPYDRARTTMAAYELCPECAREYADPADRRFHAQPNACHVCGPHISLTDRSGKTMAAGADAMGAAGLIEKAAGLLADGAILGIKGLGGFHIACRADREGPVRRLRERKRREEKPMAMMVKDLGAARRLAALDDGEAARLVEVDAPILLLHRLPDAAVAPSVALRSRTFGVMLPYTPLQHLLFSRIDFPLVMTSGNFSDEPIVFRNDEALSSLKPICDYFILGDRDIHVRTDDSVIRLFRGRDFIFRRARGFVPAPVALKAGATRPVLGVGAELKNTVCLASGDRAFMSQHIGDLKNRETCRVFLETIRHFMALLEIRPRLIAHDLHPQYLSTQFALDPPSDCDWVMEALKLPVQHHHAHIASVLAERGLDGPVIGVALDGTGLGPDGSLWGGEILEADLRRFERRAHLAPVTLPGGDLAVREPWRMALAFLSAAFGDEWRSALTPALRALPEQKLIVTMAQLQNSSLLPLTTSCGRLFDAVSALAGICLAARYEGQPAIELEQVQGGRAEGGYPFPLREKSDMLVIDWREAIRGVSSDVLRGITADVVSARFHEGLVAALVEAVRRVADAAGIHRVALSGGCFMNRTLLEGMAGRLEELGLEPLYNSRVSANDGGIALGQAAVAAASAG